jgi:hypothetical protein
VAHLTCECHQHLSDQRTFYFRHPPTAVSWLARLSEGSCLLQPDQHGRFRLLPPNARHASSTENPPPADGMESKRT